VGDVFRKIGLTGSIGMGKSMVSSILLACDIPVYDADRVVSELYERDALPFLRKLCPDLTQNDKVNRDLLWDMIIADPMILKDLEDIIHPLVLARERAFINEKREQGYKLVVLDIPLLFECGRGPEMDFILVSTTSTEIQRSRVLSRPGMTEAKFQCLLSRQLPDAWKCAHADFVIDTSHGKLATAKQTIDAITLRINRCL